MIIVVGCVISTWDVISPLPACQIHYHSVWFSSELSLVKASSIEMEAILKPHMNCVQGVKINVNLRLVHLNITCNSCHS